MTFASKLYRLPFDDLRVCQVFVKFPTLGRFPFFIFLTRRSIPLMGDPWRSRFSAIVLGGSFPTPSCGNTKLKCLPSFQTKLGHSPHYLSTRGSYWSALGPWCSRLDWLSFSTNDFRVDWWEHEGQVLSPTLGHFHAKLPTEREGHHLLNGDSMMPAFWLICSQFDDLRVFHSGQVF